MIKYRITGACPFGTCKVLDNGMMDHSQFRSDNPDDYKVCDTGAILALHVAQHYGAQPVCTIEATGVEIEVYRLMQHYGISCRLDGGWCHESDIVWANTVNPLALINYAAEVAKSFAR